MEHLHEGHRARMRERFAKNGFEGFSDHEVLEVVLFGAIARGNTNPLGHRLIEKFGSFADVCDASIEELMTVEGIGRTSALQIKMIPELCRVYLKSHENKSENQDLSSSERLMAYLRPHFISKTKETLLLLTLDNKSQPIECTTISEGSVNSAGVDMRKITETVIRTNASAAILAHNHPNGHAIPSNNDIAVTKHVRTYLADIGVPLVDHLIYTERDCISFRESGYSFIDKKEHSD